MIGRPRLTLHAGASKRAPVRPLDRLLGEIHDHRNAFAVMIRHVPGSAQAERAKPGWAVNLALLDGARDRVAEHALKLLEQPGPATRVEDRISLAVRIVQVAGTDQQAERGLQAVKSAFAQLNDTHDGQAVRRAVKATQAHMGEIASEPGRNALVLSVIRPHGSAPGILGRMGWRLRGEGTTAPASPQAKSPPAGTRKAKRPTFY